MRFPWIAILFLALAGTAQAQQPLDPAFMQHVLDAVATQRNQAMNIAASNEAKAASLADELAKAQARIKELESKQEEKK